MGRFMSLAGSQSEQFTPRGRVLEVHEFGNGNINDTYLVTTDSNEETYFVLQRINTQVFRHPRLIMQNMRIFTEHMRMRARLEGHSWEMPRDLETRDGQDFYIDTENNFWRAISYVQGARSFDTIGSLDHAREVGHALGTFQHLISDLPVERLADTLEGFHIMPRYLEQYDWNLSQNGHASNAEVRLGMDFIAARRAWAHVLEEARHMGKLQLRPIHGDLKVNNVMIQESTGRTISLVDQDTVKPGLIHYDIGDCMRSGCNPLGEETEHWEAVCFEPEIGEAILAGYLAEARHFLTTYKAHNKMLDLARRLESDRAALVERLFEAATALDKIYMDTNEVETERVAINARNGARALLARMEADK